MAPHRAAVVFALVVTAALALSLLPTAGLTAPGRSRGWSAGVESWVTDLHTDQRLDRQPQLRWRPGTGDGATVVVDPTRRYQTMIGFGASMTDSSAHLLSRLPVSERRSIMTELFSTRNGIGLSILRQPMGASDFAVQRAYSYDDQPAGQTDADLSDFSIDHDRADILPRLREAYAINPEISFMGSPWSAPGWMKDTGSLIKGSLLPGYQEAYAQYFVRFVEAYAAAGIPTHYLSIQNEPLYQPDDYPGMSVLPDQAVTLIAGQLAPALERAGHGEVAILGYDHNWDIPDYPEAIYSDQRVARSVTGTAWHCYAGEVVAQSLAHNSYPHAQAFLTECSGGGWQGTRDEAFERTMDMVIGVPRHWGQSVILWNLALDQRNGPFIGGCMTCRGIVTVNDDETVTKNLEYWALGHSSRFVAPGAVRIASSQPDDSAVTNVAYRNRDGSMVLVAHNQGAVPAAFAVAVGTRHVDARLAPGAAATYLFRAPDRWMPAGDPGWVDLDFGSGPVGTPGGRLIASVGPEVVDALSQVNVCGRWLAYSLPYGAELSRSGPVTDLPREAWELHATGVIPVEGDPLANALDQNPATRWSSGESQHTGMSLTIDLGSAQPFTEVSLDVGQQTGEYLRSYSLQVSDDGVGWRSVAHGPGRTGEMIIALPETAARYLRISSTSASVSRWSVAELEVRRAELAEVPVTGGWGLIADRGTFRDGSTVVGHYNAGRRPQRVPWPVTGFDYIYRLPPTAAATFVVPALWGCQAPTVARNGSAG